MGLLSKGTPLEWRDSLQHHGYVKYHGILQFLKVYAAQRNRTDDTFLWGDEVEHLLLHVSPHTASHKKVQLSLRAAELIESLEQLPGPASTDSPNHPTTRAPSHGANFLPEYGRFMIEATPAGPYGGFTADLRKVEANMRERRALIEKILLPTERLITLTVFPLLGCPDFAQTSDHPCKQLQGPVADSDYIMDQIIGAHPRFATLTRNIRTRRGARVDIRVPLFQDVNTQRDIAIANQKEQEFLDQLALTRSPEAPIHMPRPADLDLTKQIHMDAMAFGMGCSCLQVTFQTRSLTEARHLYDHLAVLSPIMLALTGASPFFHGRVSDIDARWTVISQSVDDRTPIERGLEKMPDGTPVEERNISADGPYVPSSSATPPNSELPARKPQRLYKSRYDSISTYISLEDDFRPAYNDIPCEIDEPSYNQLLAGGVDELLARHIAHLFVRDPLVIYDEHIHLDDDKSSDHFENLQSTNWQSVRFKPPTPGSSIGWRVEFRTMEIQITDFENAAFTVFIALVSRALLYFNLNFYIPISKVDANMERAHRRDAVTQEKFFWRKNIKVCQSSKEQDGTASSSSSSSSSAPSPSPAASSTDDDGYEEMSIRDIMLGTSTSVDSTTQPGLINLVRTYLDMIECDDLTRRIVDEYLDLISKRASGELMTAATWLRKYVSVHPAYQHNSILNDEIVYDIVETCGEIVKGNVRVPQLLGEYTNLPKVLSADGGLESSRELKGARCGSTASSSSSSSSGSIGDRVLDLNEHNCCQKLKMYLQPYLMRANSNGTGGSSTPTTPTKQQPTHKHNESESSTESSPGNAIVWTSPQPQP